MNILFGGNKMNRLAGPKATYYLGYKKISKEELIKLIGKDKVDKYTESAWENTLEDPNVQNDYPISQGMLTIEF